MRATPEQTEARRRQALLTLEADLRTLRARANLALRSAEEAGREDIAACLRGQCGTVQQFLDALGKGL